MVKIEYTAELVYDTCDAAVEAVRAHGRVYGYAVSIRRTVRVCRKASGSIKSIELQFSKAGTFVSRAT